jgi:hypothetical protein
MVMILRRELLKYNTSFWFNIHKGMFGKRSKKGKIMKDFHNFALDGSKPKPNRKEV